MSDGYEYPPDRRWGSISIGVVAVIAIILAIGFAYYERDNPDSFVYCWFHHNCRFCRSDPNCRSHEDIRVPLRPASTPDAQPSIPTIFALRHAAWQNDDFWAQVRLGRLYYASRDNSSWNPVEAYVWYFLASINPQARYDSRIDYDGDKQYGSVSETLTDARHIRAQIAELFTSDQRDEAQKRIVYVLACRGPVGFALLGELYSPWSPVDSEEDFDEPRDDTRARGSSALPPSDDTDREPVRPIAANDHDAMLYYDLAATSGSNLSSSYQDYVTSYEYFLRTNRSDGADIIASAAADAQRWHLPFEYYPESRARSGIPLTDECNANAASNYEPDADDEPIAAWTLQQGLFALHEMSVGPVQHQFDLESPQMRSAIQKYQVEAGFPPTGRPTISQELDIVSRAAEQHDPPSEIALGKMYVLGTIQSIPSVANGDGEVWWERVANDPKAGNLNRGMAYYDLYTLYANGYGLVPPDCKAASSYFVAARSMGFDPRLAYAPGQRVYDSELAPDRAKGAGRCQGPPL